MTRKMKGMGGHMDAALITKARDIRKFYEARAAVHDRIADDIDNPPFSKREQARMALAFGNLDAALMLVMEDTLGIKRENKSAKEHRAIARSLRTKGGEEVAKIREQLKDRGVYNIKL